MKLKIIDFEKKYENEVMKLFYNSVFYTRKEFDYARIPSWFHRYSLEKNVIIRLANMNNKIVGSLGLIPYFGYVCGEKQKIGFFVDNCVLPKYNLQYDQIMKTLFKDIEKIAKKEKINFIFGWEYTKNANKYNDLFKVMAFSRIDGINWFGGGTKTLHCFPRNEFHLSLWWKLILKVLSYKYYLKELRLDSLYKNEKIRIMQKKDIPNLVKLFNNQNKNLDFSPRYTNYSLKKLIKKYNAKGFVAEDGETIVGAILLIVNPWSGWMYGKPGYSTSFGIFLIPETFEFAVKSEYSKRIAPHLLFNSMKDEKIGKYLMLVGLFDRRISWLRKAFLDVGADELPYDFGTVFFKNLDNKKIRINRPIYVPTNLVISPYTSKGI